MLLFCPGCDGEIVTTRDIDIETKIAVIEDDPVMWVADTSCAKCALVLERTPLGGP